MVAGLSFFHLAMIHPRVLYFRRRSRQHGTAEPVTTAKHGAARESVRPHFQ